MNLHCVHSAAADDLARHLGDEDRLVAAIERRTEQRRMEYRQDLGIIHDAVGDLSCRPLGKMIDLLMLIRDGSDDAELGRLVRLATMEEVDEAAACQAERELTP